jgi:hypothetical protein
VPLASPEIFDGKPQRKGRHFVPLRDNGDLCHFLNEAILSGCVEIGLHGLRHGPGEFDLSDRSGVSDLLNETERLVRSSVPRAELRTFVPPRESLSGTAQDVLLQRGFNICAASTALWPPSRVGWWLHRLSRWLDRPGFHKPVSHRGIRWLFPCDEYLFAPDRRPQRCLSRARRMASVCRRLGIPLICVNHHWEFLGTGGSGLLEAWLTFLHELLHEDDVHVTTFNTYQPCHTG